MLLADIASGNYDAADVFFLLAAIVFGVDAILTLAKVVIPAPIKAALIPIGLCLVAIALLLL